MARSTLRVFLDGTRAGTLFQDANGRSTFQYTPEYLSSPSPTPLSISMPLQPALVKSKSTEAFFSGLLPDNPETLRAWGTKYGASPNNAFALLRHVGRDTAGALQILGPEVPSTDATERTENIQWHDDAELQELIRGLKANNNWDAMRTAGRWSLAGAQSKVALFHDRGLWGTPMDSTPTTHILKPTIPGLEAHDVNEYMCMEVAGRLGMPAAKTELLSVGDERILVSTRYDRAKLDGRWIRIHQEDLCQALSMHPSQKYQLEGGPSVKHIARLLNRLGTQSQESSSRMFDYLNYNVAIGATDAHAKNFSLIHSGSFTTLSPLYDVASYLPYDQSGSPANHGIKFEPAAAAMRMGKHYDLAEIGESDMIAVGRNLGVSSEDAVHRYRQLREQLPDQFHAVASELEGTPYDDGMSRRLAKLIEGRIGPKTQIRPAKPLSGA